MASIRTPFGVLSFPNLFSPRPRAPGGEPVYNCSLLFDENAQRDPAYKALKRAVQEEIDDKCGPGKSRDAQFMSRLRLPFRPTSEKQYNGYDIPNGVFISPWSKMKPGLVDAMRNEILVPEDIWPGQLVRATVSPFYYNISGNQGVSFALNNLQVCRTDGPRLDGRKKATEDFPDYDGPDAAVMVDDEIPF
jgi:Enterobacter phage Enc34, ssDNA-binding protein